MGFVNAAITYTIGYFIIKFIEKNKPLLRKFPVVKDYVEDNQGCSNDAYLLLFGFVAKDFLI